MSNRTKAVFIVLALIFCGTLFFAHSAEVDAAVVKQGSRGAIVTTIQTKLKNWGYYTGGVDGVFGSKTRTAVIYFQKKNGLTQDGIVGAKTAAAMGIQLSSSSSSSSSSNYNSDLYLMARAVYGEARGEPYTGKVAVAAIILNRVKHKDFPSTVSGVIYQPWAFTAVHDGQINLEEHDYLMIGTLVSYRALKAYFGEERIVPLYIQVEDGERLFRAIERERKEAHPRYTELCRRFLADEEDFSEEKLQEAGIRIRFENRDLASCLSEIEGFISRDKEKSKRGDQSEVL